MVSKYRYYFISLIALLSSYTYSDEMNAGQTRSEAHEKLESGFEKAAIGTVELGISVWRASVGDPVGAAVAAVEGVNTIKSSVVYFKESKNLFEKARAIEKQYELSMDPSEPADIIRGLSDREY
jgi:hypothetical protein